MGVGDNTCKSSAGLRLTWEKNSQGSTWKQGFGPVKRPANPQHLILSKLPLTFCQWHCNPKCWGRTDRDNSSLLQNSAEASCHMEWICLIHCPTVCNYLHVKHNAVQETPQYLLNWPPHPFQGLYNMSQISQEILGKFHLALSHLEMLIWVISRQVATLAREKGWAGMPGVTKSGIKLTLGLRRTSWRVNHGLNGQK